MDPLSLSVIESARIAASEETLTAAEVTAARAVLTQLDVACWVTRLQPERRIVYISPGFERLWGLRPETFYRDYEAWNTVIHPDDLAHSEAAFQATLRSGSMDLEYRIVLPDGRTRWVHDRGVVEYAADRTPVQIVGIAEDVTTQRLADAALRASEEKFARSFDLSPLILTITDAETGRFVEVNEAFVQVSGFSRAEAEGRTPIELGLWEQTEEWSRGRAALLAGEQIRGRETRFRVKNGSVLECLVSGALVDLGGSPCILSALTDITGRRTAEHNLARYRLMAENSRDVLLFTQVDGAIVEANAAAVHAYGYARHEFAGMPIATLRAGETLGELDHQLAEAASGSIRFETRHRRRDGSTFPVEVVAESALVGGERLVLSIVRDLSDRDAAEIALRDSEERLRLALDAAGMSSWEVNLQTGARRASGHHVPMLGSAPSTFDALLQLIHPEDRDRVKAAALAAVARGADYAEEFRTAGTDGSTRWIAASGRPHPDPNRRGSVLIGVSQDVTDRKAAETGLRASEERFRALAEAVPHLVWTCAPDGQCDYLSRQWVEYTGVPEQEQLGFGWFEAVHPDDRERVADSWNAAVDERTPELDVEFRIRRSDGVHRWFKTRAVPVRSLDGTIVKWCGSNTDIDEIRSADQRRRAMIDALVHDLQNPLAAILAQAQLLGRRVRRGDEIGLDRLDALTSSVKQASALVEELGDAAALAAGEDLALVREAVDLVALARRVAADYDQTSERHQVRVEAAEPAVFGEWDASRLERVLANLLSNAVKYSPDGGEIVVRLGRWADDPQGWAELAVSDQGMGIPADDLPSLFGRHRRGGNVGRIPGTGLGLAGAADVLRLHGGTIAVESEIGHGSFFTIRLPIAPPPDYP